MSDAYLGKAEVTEYGVHFATGEPVTFRYVRNTEKSPNFGGRYQQDIEPAGRYLLHNPDPGDLPPRWMTGKVTLHSPLVLAFSTGGAGGYDDHNWKARLVSWYGRKGHALTRKILEDGYDGIVTVGTDRSGRGIETREIVVLPPKLKLRGR